MCLATIPNTKPVAWGRMSVGTTISLIAMRTWTVLTCGQAMNFQAGDVTPYAAIRAEKQALAVRNLGTISLKHSKKAK